MLGVIAAVWLAIALAGMGVWGLARETIQEQWQQQQQLQQRVMLQAWAQQLTLRLEGYQRLLLGLVQLEQMHGLERLQREAAAVTGFSAVFLVRRDGAAQQLVPLLQAVESGTVFSAAERNLLQRGQTTGGLAVSAQAMGTEPEWVQLTWVQPLRNPQGQLTALLLARAELPKSVLLPNFFDSVHGAAGLLFTLQDKDSGWSLQSEGLAQVQHARSSGVVETLALPAPAWVLQSQRAPSAAALVWPWQGIVLGIVVLCAAATYVVCRQLRIGDKVKEGQRGQRPLPLAHQVNTAGWGAFLQASPGAMWVVQGPIIQAANTHTYTLLGYAPEFLAGMWLHCLLVEHAQQQAVQQAVLTTGHYCGQLQLRKADGEAVLVEVMAYRLEGGQEADDAAVWQLWGPWSQLPTPPNLARAGVVSQDILLHWLQMRHQQCQDGHSEGVAPATGSLLFIDIDCLGALNETVDRAFGDEVLAWVGQRLRQMVLPIGRAVHLGGDEFAAVLPTVGQHHALLIGERLCQQVHAWQPQWQGEKHWVSISIGVVAWDARLHDGPSILRAADMACYQAKRKGKAQVAVGTL